MSCSAFQERNLLAATGKAAIRNSLALTSSLGIGERTRGKRSLSARCVTEGLCAATTSPNTHGDTWPPRRSHPGKQRCGTSTRSPLPRPCPLAQHYRSACCCQPLTDFDGDWTLNPSPLLCRDSCYEGKAADSLMGKNVIMHWTPVFFCCTYFAHFVYYCVKDLCTLFASLCTMFVLKFLTFSSSFFFVHI